MSICFHCGRKLKGEAVYQDFHGSPVAIHKRCVEAHKAGNITARATTTGEGATIVQDHPVWTGHGLATLVYVTPSHEQR